MVAGLPAFGAPPQLQARLVHVAQPVGAPAGQLPAIGVDRQAALQRDTPSTFDKGPAFTHRAQTQGFQPDQGQDRETVVQLR
ncbi:hypothetical protein D3C79_907200 [compost metagenome]